MLLEVPVGQRVKATLTYKDENGAAADPTTASAKVRHPSGTIDTYTVGGANDLTKTGTGIYTLTFVPDAEGRWYVKGVGAGVIDVVSEPDFVLVTQDVMG